MNIKFPKWFVIGGVALVLVTNAIVLAGVAYNRSSARGGQLVLTDREVNVYGDYSSSSENSGLNLALNIHNQFDLQSGRNPASNVSWLTQAKLRELGFKLPTGSVLDAETARAYRDQEKLVYVVLELNGDAYKQEVDAASKRAAEAEASAAAQPDNKEHQQVAKNLREQANQLQISGSRLYSIDAGVDEKSLHARYSDATQYAIVQGTIRTTVYSSGDTTVTGWFDGVTISKINVPLKWRSIIDNGKQSRAYRFSGLYEGIFDKDAYEKQKHFDVTIAWGRRFEPWIEEVKSVQ